MAEVAKHAWTGASQLEPRLDAEFYQEHFLAAERRLKRVPVARFHSLWRDSNRIYIGIAGFSETTEDREYTPYIRPTDVGPNGEIDWRRIAWCYAEWLNDYAGSGCAKPGDLLVEVKGNTRRVAVVDEKVPKNCIVSGSFWRLSLTESTNPRFVLAFLLSDTGQLLKRRWVSNSVISWIDPHSFRSFLIPTPDRQIQDYIAAKVELAERCRDAAAANWADATRLLAASLGTSLDPQSFEPASAASVSGDGYEVVSLRPAVARVGAERLDRYIGAQFFHPRRARALLVLEKSGLRSKRLEQLATRFAERISSEEMAQQRLPYVGLAEIDPSNGFIASNSEEEPSGGSARFAAGDILFSKLRPYLNKVSICPEHYPKAAGSTELVTYRAREGVDPYFLFFVLKSPLVLNQVIDITSGSTHPRVAPELLDEVLVPDVPQAEATAIARLARASLTLTYRATALVDEAKAEVEDFIDGKLDTDAIVNGRAKAPTAKDVPGLREGPA